MSRNRGLGTMGAVLLAIVAILAVPTTWAQIKYKTLYKFTGGTDGNAPDSVLIFDASGNLYGTTEGGGFGSGCGSSGCGTVFKLTPTGNGGWTESVIHSFDKDGKDGLVPLAGVIFDQSGNLYGTTAYGGVDNEGTVFQLAPSGHGAWTESVLYSFKAYGKDGEVPAGRLTFDSKGNLYGTTYDGGQSESYGTVFELSPNGDGSWTENVLHSFSATDGADPHAGLIFDSAGNLYGTTVDGGTDGDGTVFELSPNGDGSWTENVLHFFNGKDGFRPYCNLVFDTAGNLYGTTSSMGAYGYGTAFQLIPNGDGSWTENVLLSFDRTDGSYPFGGLIFDSAGNLYGTTGSGGGYGKGTVFTLKPTRKRGWRETVLHRFRNRPGADPFASLTFDGRGSLYGTTRGDGGMRTWGSVFKITP